MTTGTQPGAVTTTRGPFALLRDTDEAEQVLILTYTATLEFFERFALGEARGMQAATTVISDAAMVAADPGTVRGAGVRYLDVRAVCPGSTAFHPKLVAIVGSDNATVAIGSGNLTLAGWHSNEELWTVVHANRDRGPTTIRDIAQFLRALADGRIRLSAEAPDALAKVADLLDRLAAGEPGPKLLSTLDSEPILNRLPSGPVDRLAVYAPYFDASLAALSAVYARMQPREMTVHVQPQTSVDGAALKRWLEERGGRLRWCSGGRFRHGKLLEWSHAGVHEALTGSPNMSAPALLRVIRPSGPGAGPEGYANCELATITRISGSLAPTEAPPPAEGAARLKFVRDPDAETRPRTVLLGATLVGHADVQLRLASTLRYAARIQVHDPEHDWTTLTGHAELLAGTTEYRVPAVGLPAGTALRLYGDGDASNEVFVVDPVRAQLRPYKRVGPDAGSPQDLVLDGRLDVLYEIAALMRPTLLKLGALVTKPAGGQGTEPEDDQRPEAASPKPGMTLEEYLAKCSAVLDEKVVEWALGIPALPSLGLNRIDRQAGVLTTEIGDEAADAGDDEDEPVEEPGFAEAIRKATAHRRRQWRDFCGKALTLAVGWTQNMRILLARLVLNGIAADLWPDEDVQGEILKRLVVMLAADGDEPTEDEAIALADYAAIAIALLREQVRRLSVNDEAMLRYRAAAAAARDIVNAIDPTRVEGVIVEIADAFGHAITGEQIFDIAVEAQKPPSGVAAAVALLRDEYEIAASDQSGVLVLNDQITGLVERELVRAAGLVESAEPVIVRGRVTAVSEAICVWREPLLLFATRNPAGLNGRVYKLAPGVTPRAIAQAWTVSADVRENFPKPIEDWFPGRPTPPLATELLDLAGVHQAAGTHE